MKLEDMTYDSDIPLETINDICKQVRSQQKLISEIIQVLKTKFPEEFSTKEGAPLSTNP